MPAIENGNTNQSPDRTGRSTVPPDLSPAAEERLHQIINAVQAFSSGDLTHQVDTSGSDAIARLAQAVRDFATGKRSTVDHLRNRSAARLLHVATDWMHRRRKWARTRRRRRRRRAWSPLPPIRSRRTCRPSQPPPKRWRSGCERSPRTLRTRLGSRPTRYRWRRPPTKRSASSATAAPRSARSSRSLRASRSRPTCSRSTRRSKRPGPAKPGKGFAVVANEVKELAKETAKATEDISRKIEAIQNDTRSAVGAIQEIGKHHRPDQRFPEFHRERRRGTDGDDQRDLSQRR